MEVARLGQRVLLERSRTPRAHPRPRVSAIPASTRSITSMPCAANSGRSSRSLPALRVASSAGAGQPPASARCCAASSSRMPLHGEIEQRVELASDRRCRARPSPALRRTRPRCSSRHSYRRAARTSSSYSRSRRGVRPITPTLTADTRRFTGVAAMRPVSTSQSNASTAATHAPVIDAVRVPPSATSTSQSSLIVYSPNAKIVEHRANAPPDESLNLLRAPAELRAFARRPRLRRARQHRVLGGEPAFAAAASPAGNALLDRRRAQHARRAKRHEARPLGVRRDAALEGDGRICRRCDQRAGRNRFSSHGGARWWMSWNAQA